MKYLVGLIITLCVIVSCASIQAPVRFQYTRQDPPVNVASRIMPVFIDKSFGNEDRLHIDDALNRWNYALNGFIKLEIKSAAFDMDIADIQYAVANHGLMIIPVNSETCPFIPRQSDPRQMSVAWADLTTRTTIYVVRDRLKTQDLFPVLLHEVGHILGADHTKDASLMYPTYTPAMYACIDKETMQQVATFNNIPIQHLNYCEFIYENVK